MSTSTTDEPTPIPDIHQGFMPFMRSQRPDRAGRPDTEFYWLRVGETVCIGKAMTMALGPQVADLVDNERQVLKLLMDKKAPVCQLVGAPDHPHWLVTEFAGLSLQLLGEYNRGGWPALSIQERVSVWVHFMRKAQVLADLGAVPIDLAERNLVVPIGSSGHLQLNEAVSIDHAHTVLPSARLPGGELRRPVWMDPSRSTHLAPEIRVCLQRDLDRFLAHLNAVGAAVPGTTAAVMDPKQLSAETWLAYKEPQEIQLRINDGSIEADKVIQYAVGDAIHLRLKPDSPYTSRIAPVVRRLCARDPNQRFKKLEHAADALKTALDGKLALTSVHPYQPRLPEDLVPLAEPAQQRVSLDSYGLASSQPSPGEDEAVSTEGTLLVDAASGNEPTLIRQVHTHTTHAPPDPLPFTAPHPKAAGQPAAIHTAAPKPKGSGWHWYLVAVALALATGIPLGLWLTGT